MATILKVVNPNNNSTLISVNCLRLLLFGSNFFSTPRYERAWRNNFVLIRNHQPERLDTLRSFTFGLISVGHQERATHPMRLQGRVTEPTSLRMLLQCRPEFKPLVVSAPSNRDVDIWSVPKPGTFADTGLSFLRQQHINYRSSPLIISVSTASCQYRRGHVRLLQIVNSLKLL